MSKPYAQCPVAALALDQRERAEVLDSLGAFLQSVGAPGDYGYDSKLGRLVHAASELRQEIERTPARAEEAA